MLSAEDNHLRSRRTPRRLLLAVCLVAAGVIIAPTHASANPRSAPTKTNASGRVPADAVEVFDTDVYVVTGTGDLIHPDPRTTPSGQELFNVAGEDLGVTFGSWQSASATSLAKTVKSRGADETDIRLAFSHLLPGEVYSVFYETFGPDSANPVCPTIEPLIAFPAAHPKRTQPDADSFTTNRTGAAKFHARAAGKLLADQQLNIVAIAQFDGETYGPVPNRAESQGCRENGYGDTTARHLLIIQTGL